MGFHFPVMPRIYYAMREEKAAPIVEILADTPDIPAGAQWGTFLRNHDELTLEMVTTEERAAMYGWYAPDPRMRANIGIRRRLAPLLDNSRAEIELHQRAAAVPAGQPCLYYGDEIGMGDNIWLADRDAVRTPMQWTPDRNAGFSTADPGKLYLPVVQSLVYHYGGTNVEAQLATASSLLHWTREHALRPRQHPVFGLGRFVQVPSDNHARARVPAGAAPGRGAGRARRDRALREQPRPRAAGHDPRPAGVPAGPRSRTSSAAWASRTCPPTGSCA